MTKFTILEDTVSVSGQSAYRKVFACLGDLKLRFSIKSDSYQSQSHAKVDVWSGVEKGWTLVWSILPVEMKTETSLAYLPHGRLTKSHFEQDLMSLKKRSATILL